MKIAKILPAIVGFTLVPAAGTLAADSLDSGTAGLDFAAPTTQMSGSDFFSQGILPNLRWSVSGAYALSQEDEEKGGTDLRGLILGIGYKPDEHKELFLGFSYMTGENDKCYSGKVDIDRFEAFGGFNYWISISEKFSAYFGGKIGFSQYVLSGGTGVSKREDYTFTGGLNAGGVYSVTETMNIRAGVEYTTPLARLSSDYYEEFDCYNFVIISAGLEFKF